MIRSRPWLPAMLLMLALGVFGVLRSNHGLLQVAGWLAILAAGLMLVAGEIGRRRLRQ
jgi:hypothetical protein